MNRLEYARLSSPTGAWAGRSCFGDILTGLSGRTIHRWPIFDSVTLKETETMQHWEALFPIRNADACSLCPFPAQDVLGAG